MADDRRDLDVALRVTKEGDPGAFKETAEDVRELRKEAEGAAPALDDLGESTSSAGEAAGEAAEEVGELGRSSADTVGKLADISSKAALVAGAFKAGWEAGKLLREGLNDLTDGEFDRTISGWFEGLANWVAGADEAAGATDRLRNAQNILVKNGIDPAGKSLAEMDAIIEELSKKKYEAAEAAEAQAEATEAYAEKLGLSKRALDESASGLAEFIAAFSKANSQLSKEDLGQIFGKQIQEVLNAYSRLKQDPQQAIAELAKSWGIVTTEAAKAADAQKAVVERIVSDITGTKDKLKVPLEELGKALSEALGKIDFGQLDTQGLEKAKQTFQEFIDRSREAGKQIPSDIADQAASMGILVGAMEVAGGASSSLSGSQSDLAGSSVQLTEKIDETGKKTYELKQRLDEAGGAATSAGQQVADGANAAGEGASAVDQINQKWADLKKSQEEAGEAAAQAGEKVASGADAAADGAAGLEDAGAAAKEAGSGLKEVKEGAEGLGGASEAGKAGVEQLKGALEGLAEPIGSVQSALQSLSEIDLSGTVGQLSAVGAACDAIVTKANAARSALDAIDQAGAG